MGTNVQRSFVSLLKQNAQTLTWLEPDMGEDDNLLKQVLDACPNLTHLRVMNRHRGSRTANPKSISLDGPPLKLTHLLFHWGKRDALALLSFFIISLPEPTSLWNERKLLSACRQTQDCALVQPTLSVLGPVPFLHCTLSIHVPRISFEKQGTRNIADIGDMPLLDDELGPLLAKQRETLEILWLDLDRMKRPQQILKSVGSIGGFTQLYELEIARRKADVPDTFIGDSDDTSSYESSGVESSDAVEIKNLGFKSKQVANIIGTSPQLRSVRLVNLCLDDVVFKNLSKREHLRRFELFGSEGVSPKAITQLFQRATCLETFIYEEYSKQYFRRDVTVADILLAIAQSPSKSLKELRLLNCKSYRREHLAKFVESMQDGGRLSRLTVFNGSFNQDKLEFLFKIPTLTKMRLDEVHVNQSIDIKKALIVTLEHCTCK